MEIGQLRHRVELINIGRTKTAAGGLTRADSVEAVLWANVKLASWSQQQRADKPEQRVSHTVTIRFNRDYANGFGKEARCRFTDQAGRTRELAIKTVIDPDERGNWLELGCEEGGPV